MLKLYVLHLLIEGNENSLREYAEIRHQIGFQELKKKIKMIESQMILQEDKIKTKWKSEQDLFKLVKSHFNNAIMHASPSWLKPQSLDIFIEDKNLAIEYQGKQHYQIKGLVQLQLKGQMDVEVYQEEQARIGAELEGLHEQKREMEKIQDTKEQYKQRVQEIILVFKQKEGLLEQFDDGIFNALVEKIEILSPMHFVFVLKSGMRVEENICRN